MALTEIKVNNSSVIGVDDEPIAGSNNLVKSGGVYKSINGYKLASAENVTTTYAVKFVNILNNKGSIAVKVVTSNNEPVKFGIIDYTDGTFILDSQLRTNDWYVVNIPDGHNTRIPVATTSGTATVDLYVTESNSMINAISFLSETDPTLIKCVNVGKQQTFTNNEKKQGRQNLGLGTGDIVTELTDNNDIVLSGVINKAVMQNSSRIIGDIIKPASWSVGKYKSNGTIDVTATTSKCCVVDISNYRNKYINIRTNCPSDAYCVFFAENDNVISTFAGESTPVTKEDCYIRNIYIPHNVYKIGISNVGILEEDEVFIMEDGSISNLYTKIRESYTDFALKTEIDNVLTYIYLGNSITEDKKYINSSGIPTPIDSSDFFYTYIKIPFGAVSIYCDMALSRWNVGCLFDAELELIITIGNTSIDGTKSFDLTDYQNAKYIGINLKKSWNPNASNFDGSYRVFKFGFNASGTSTEVTDELGNSSSKAASQKLVTNLYNEGRTYGHCLNKPFELNNKKITFFGDSITKGVSSAPVWGEITNCWAKLFTDHFNGTMDNQAHSATHICKPAETNSITNTILNYSDTTDFIIIAGGTNDYTNQSNLGTYGDNTNTSVYGCMELICQKLMQDYPDVPVVFITPINRTNTTYQVVETITFNQYRNAIWEVATKYGLNVIDGSMIAGFPNFREATSVIKSLLLHDGIHPTDTGHRYYAECVAGIIG